MNIRQERCEHDRELPSYWNDGVAHCHKCDIHADQAGYIIDYNTQMLCVPNRTKIYRPKYPQKLDWMIVYD
jgi:hypothetical protein